jgi:16S rRNA (guanine527-N7)-methyltransferase
MTEAERFAEALHREFSGIGAVSEQQAAELYLHFRLLHRWNKVLNLTSVQRLEDAVVRHYCESLFVGAHLPEHPLSVLDVGSGAGFPGIPIAVFRPECRVTLAESHQRKAVFLREATRHLANVSVVARRAEQIELAFDWVVSRAVRWEQVVPLARGSVALLLGREDAAAAVSGCQDFVWREPIALPWGQRRVLLLGERRA